MNPPKIYGLLGFPLKHSLSPAMHNAAFRALEINAEYKLFPLKEEEIAGFLKNLNLNHIFGLNVTIPYKEKVIPFLNNISDEARLIGAINTIRVSDNKLEGFNTDGEGFLRHLKVDLRFNPQDKIIAIIGAGGASRAVAIYLCKSKSKKIKIYDIERAKTQALISHLRENFNNIILEAADSIETLNIEECDLLINATPVGLKETDPCLVDEKFIHKDMLVYDLIYNPKETKLLKMAKEKGARVANGLNMLLYQGAGAFELWTENKAPIEIMRKALMEAIYK